MALTDAKLRALKPRERLYRVADRDGLCIEVRPSGSRLWRFRYRHAGRASMIGLGAYPQVTLQEARLRLAQARAALAAGTDPGAARRRERQAARADDFESVAREWLALQRKWTPATRAKAEWLLGSYAFPWIGRRAVGDITAPETLELLRRPEALGKFETAHRLKQRCSRIFGYAIATGRSVHNPAAELAGVLATAEVRHRASITERVRVGELMRAIDGYQGHFVTACALRLSPLVFLRPGELRKAEWCEIDLGAAEWRIPVARMKMRLPHLVPLSRQAVAILRELEPVTGRGRYVFPGLAHKHRPMSENAITGALRRLGYSGEDMTAHGFRSMASTLLNESGFDRDWIERQLAHADRDAVRAAYNYAQYLPQRRQMMQAWADMLDRLRADRKVVPLRA